MMNSRQEIVEEMILREQIRKVIRIVKERRKKEADAWLHKRNNRKKK